MRIVGFAEFASCCRYGVQYRLQVIGGARDYGEHLTSCGLIFERLLQLAFTGLLSLKQPRVFYRDDGLISEGLEQFDLSIAEWADLSASNVNHANSGTCANQGHGEIGAKTEASSDVASLRVLISFGLQIGYVDRSPFQNGT